MGEEKRRDYYPLPCPECRLRLLKRDKPIEGGNRIGNQRGRCDTCNAWTQAVKRGVARRIALLIDEETMRQIRTEVELSLYPGVIERWNEKKGLES